MKRRALITTLAVGLAGCSGFDRGEAKPATTSRTPTDTPTQTLPGRPAETGASIEAVTEADVTTPGGLRWRYEQYADVRKMYWNTERGISVEYVLGSNPEGEPPETVLWNMITDYAAFVEAVPQCTALFGIPLDEFYDRLGQWHCRTQWAQRYSESDDVTKEDYLRKVLETTTEV